MTHGMTVKNNSLLIKYYLESVESNTMTLVSLDSTYYFPKKNIGI